MLVSSVTLGLLSDRLGRLRCTQFGYALAILANLAAIFSPNYFLLNICIFLMSYAQVGAANALCTLRKYLRLSALSLSSWRASIAAN